MRLCNFFRHAGFNDGGMMERLIRPAVFLGVEESKVGRSKIGGAPVWGAPAEWPVGRNGPLSLLVDLDLAEVTECGVEVGLPHHGRLQFFYDLVDYPAGSDGDHRDGWRVVWLPGLTNGEFQRALSRSSKLPAKVVRERALLARSGWTLPDVGALAFWDEVPSEVDVDRMWAVRDAWESTLRPGVSDPTLKLQMGGHPRLHQGDVFVTAEEIRLGRTLPEVSTAGLDRTVAFEQSREWILLLQVPSLGGPDDDFELCFGDMGSLSYCIRLSDLRERRFDRVQLVADAG
jgi:uncharacterized protein YwqG